MEMSAENLRDMQMEAKFQTQLLTQEGMCSFIYIIYMLHTKLVNIT